MKKRGHTRLSQKYNIVSPPRAIALHSLIFNSDLANSMAEQIQRPTPLPCRGCTDACPNREQCHGAPWRKNPEQGGDVRLKRRGSTGGQPQ